MDELHASHPDKRPHSHDLRASRRHDRPVEARVSDGAALLGPPGGWRAPVGVDAPATRTGRHPRVPSDVARPTA